MCVTRGACALGGLSPGGALSRARRSHDFGLVRVRVRGVVCERGGRGCGLCGERSVHPAPRARLLLTARSGHQASGGRSSLCAYS